MSSRVDALAFNASPPLWARFLSFAGDAAVARGFRFVSLEPGALMGAAVRQTGLEDWGSDDFLEPFELFLSTAERDAKLTLFGRLMAHNQAVSALANRLRMVEACRLHPERLAAPPRRPIVIASFPRSGSSLLLRMLATHPDALSLPLWLGLTPFPVPDAAEWRAGGFGERRRRAENVDRQVATFLPEIRRTHEFGADLAVEDTYLMAPTFRSDKWWTNWGTHQFLDWLFEADIAPAYRFYRRTLQLLQGGLPGTHWVLKAPAHFTWARELHEHLPEALVVHLHRDPARVFPSIGSHLRMVQEFTTRQRDFQPAADRIVRCFEEGTRRMLALRRGGGSHRFVDIPYREVATDPIGVAGRVCQLAGVRWDDEVRAAMQAFRDANPRNKHGVHAYALGDHGQSPAWLRERFADYIDYFGVELENG